MKKYLHQKRPVLHLEVPGLQEPVLLLDMSAPQGSELHLRLVYCTLQKPVLHLVVSTPQRPELHLDLSGQQEPVLLLDLSTPRGLSCTWTFLDNRSLCFS
jgi:hypothetical protein